MQNAQNEEIFGFTLPVSTVKVINYETILPYYDNTED